MRIRTLDVMFLGMSLVTAFCIPASAQVTADPTGTTATNLGQAPSTDSEAAPMLRLPATVSFLDDDQAKPGSPTHQVGGKQVTIDVQGGLSLDLATTGFLVGGGVTFKPMKDNDRFEVSADVNYGHHGGQSAMFAGTEVSSSGSLLLFSVNAQYDFRPQDSNKMFFLGGGLAIFHFGISESAGGINVGSVSINSSGLQLLGGMAFNLAGGREVRIQIRFVTGTLILVGVAF